MTTKTTNVTLTLNIGLSVDGDKPSAALLAQRAAFVIDEVRRRGLAVMDLEGFAIVESNTEPTIVVRLNTAWSKADVRVMQAWVAGLAKAFHQEAIAALADSNDRLIGFLAGPKAEKWGPFNPEYFFVVVGMPRFGSLGSAFPLTRAGEIRSAAVATEWL